METDQVLEHYYEFIGIPDYSSHNLIDLQNRRKYLEFVLCKMRQDEVPTAIRQIVLREISKLDRSSAWRELQLAEL
jgi:hypothetical protein